MDFQHGRIYERAPHGIDNVMETRLLWPRVGWEWGRVRGDGLAFCDEFTISLE